MTSKRTFLHTVVLMLLALAIPLVLVWASQTRAPSALDHFENLAEPQYSVLKSENYKRSMQVELVVKVSETTSIKQGTAAGFVTEVIVNPGDTVRPGSALYSINGVRVIGYSPALSGTIYQDVCRNSSAALQQSAHAVMDSTGFSDATFPNFTAKVRAFEKWQGVAQPTGCLSSQHLLVVPAEPLVVKQTLIEPGFLTPALGEPVIEGEGTPESVTVRANSSPLNPGDYVITVAGLNANATLTDQTWTVQAEDLAQLIAGREAVEGQIVLAITLTDATESVILSAPTGSLVPSGDGGWCVLVSTPTGLVQHSVEITGTTPSGSAALQINPELDGVEVIANATASSPTVTCDA